MFALICLVETYVKTIALFYQGLKQDTSLLASQLMWSPKVGRKVVDPSARAKVNRYYCRPKGFTPRTSHFALTEHRVFHRV